VYVFECFFGVWSSILFFRFVFGCLSFVFGFNLSLGVVVSEHVDYMVGASNGLARLLATREFNVRVLFLSSVFEFSF